MKITPEIIKEGLTHCNLTEKTKCDNCPYAIIELADDELCSERLANDAIALIDRLQGSNEDLANAILKKEDWMQEMLTKNQQLSDRLASARDDTIKDFQKRAKEKFVSIDGSFECSEVEELIDEVALDMGEEIYDE